LLVISRPPRFVVYGSQPTHPTEHSRIVSLIEPAMPDDGLGCPAPGNEERLSLLLLAISDS
jgi:hypothetical protein